MRAVLVSIIICILAPASLFAEPKFFLEQDMCVRCHLLGDNRSGENPVVLWRRGAHFRDDSGCVDCHGGNKYIYIDYQRDHAGIPKITDITANCGKCHAKEAKLVLGKPPGEPGEFNCSITCIDCHRHHDVMAADGNLINKSNCSRCHSFDSVEPHRKAVENAMAEISGIEKKIFAYEAQSHPVNSEKRELAAIKMDFSEGFHSLPPEKIKEASIAIVDAAKKLGMKMEQDSPGKFRFSGTIVIIFLLVVAALLIGYQKAVDSEKPAEKEDGDMTKAKGIESTAPGAKALGGKAGGQGGSAPARAGSSWTTRIALLIALVALILSITGRMSSTPNAVRSVNQTVTNTVVPQLKKATDRATVDSVYELKHMVITLDEIKETSDNEEIRSMIDQLKVDLEELGVKILVHE